MLDTVIKLARPSDYEPPEGARFEVHIEKGRGISGEALKPFEAKFEVRNNAAVWTTREIEDAKLAEIKLLHDDGMSVSKIAEMVGISRATAYRLVKKAETAKTEPEDGSNEGE